MVADDELLASFEALTLDPAVLDHREHVRLGWLYVTRYPVLEALARFRDGLRRFAAHAGAAAKYHETITFACLLLIHERPRAATWEAFAAANPDLLAWPNALLARYYDRTTLASEEARRVFLLPDLR